MRLLKLDRLSPLNKVLRGKVLALILAEVRDAVVQTSREFELAPTITHGVIANLEKRKGDRGHWRRSIARRA